MFPVLIILLKVLLAAAALYRIYVLYRFKKSDQNVRLKFDLVSYIELDAGIAFTLVGLLAAIDERSYGITAGLLMFAVFLNFYHLSRMIVAGDRRILIGIHDYDLKEIKGMNASRFTLHVFARDGKKHHVIVPLTLNETLQKMKYLDRYR